MEIFNNIISPIVKQEKIATPAQKIIQEAELITIEKKDRNKEGLLLAPDGTISHYQNELYWKIIRTETFTNWFQESGVVYEDNKEPLIVFHSTLKRKLEGSSLKLNERADDWNFLGVYFSSNKKATIDFFNTQYKDDLERFERLLAEDLADKENISSDMKKYIEENDNKVKTFGAFVKIEKPLTLSNHEELMEISTVGFKRTDLLRDYDGIIVNYDREFSDQYIVFKEDNVLILPSELD